MANDKLQRRDYERYVNFKNSEGDTTLDLRPTGDSLAGKINRSITKSNTMTQPYSVTVRGMQDQLKDLLLNMKM